VNLYENVEDEDFVENFARMESWLGDGIDVAGQTFVEFIEDIYQEDKLMQNELTLGGEHVDIENIDMPVLQIVAEYDHLIPPEASKPFNDAVPSDDKTILEFPTGHIGMSVSSKSHAELWPDVCDWFEARMPDEADAVEHDVEESDGVDAAVAEDATDASAEAPDDGVEIEVESTDAPSLTDLDGIGPAYAERLTDAGYGTVAALADADAVSVADDTDLPVSRVEDWIGQATDHTSA
jgi:polyhydroxyalkanoate synthase